jgi:hypothetical protein
MQIRPYIFPLGMRELSDASDYRDVETKFLPSHLETLDRFLVTRMEDSNLRGGGSGWLLVGIGQLQGYRYCECTPGLPWLNFLNLGVLGFHFDCAIHLVKYLLDNTKA